MKCLTSRQIETYSYNDRQVSRIVSFSLGAGVILGLILAYVLHIPSAH